MLTSTKPDSKGKEAVFARAAHFTEFKWTPLCDVPTYTKKTGKTKLLAGVPLTGMPYSSTEPIDKFIAENVSFESLLSAMANPDSALYQKDINGHSNSWTYFGIVCNGFVRYCLGIVGRYNTKHWGDIRGMRKVADYGKYNENDIKLCDIIHSNGNGHNHVALITDLLRDENEKIVQIEVSEADRPTCRRVRYDLKDYFEKFEVFALWRYDFVDAVPENSTAIDTLLFEKGVSKSLPKIAVDYGDKSNYSVNEEVVISVFNEGNNEIEICRGEEVVARLNFFGRGKFQKKFERGYYTVKLLNTGDSTEFCVYQPQISHSVENGKITITVDSCDIDSKILYMDFRGKAKGDINADSSEVAKDCENIEIAFLSSDFAPLVSVEELSEEEIKTGVITKDIPPTAETFKIYFENKYGIFTHKIISFKK